MKHNPLFSYEELTSAQRKIIKLRRVRAHRYTWCVKKHPKSSFYYFSIPLFFEHTNDFERELTTLEFKELKYWSVTVTGQMLMSYKNIEISANFNYINQNSSNFWQHSPFWNNFQVFWSIKWKSAEISTF